jgi:hypothetical protein
LGLKYGQRLSDFPISCIAEAQNRQVSDTMVENATVSRDGGDVCSRHSKREGQPIRSLNRKPHYAPGWSVNAGDGLCAGQATDWDPVDIDDKVARPHASRRCWTVGQRSQHLERSVVWHHDGANAAELNPVKLLVRDRILPRRQKKRVRITRRAQHAVNGRVDQAATVHGLVVRFGHQVIGGQEVSQVGIPGAIGGLPTGE